MRLFKRKNKQNIETGRNAKNGVPKQRVISYYTASRRQLDNFERTSINQPESSLAFSRLERFRSSWFTVVIAIVILIVVGYLASLSKTPQVSINGIKYRSDSDYKKIIEDAVGNDMRNRLKPLLQVNALKESVGMAIPEAGTVTVKSSFLGHRPEVIIYTDKPIAIFSQPGSIDYLISNRGRLLLPASQSVISTAGLPLIQNLTGVNGKAGEQFMRPDETLAFNRLLAQYAAENSKPIFTLNTTPHEILAKESGRGSYQARYLLTDTITSQFGSLRATEKKLQELSQTASEYIDVRLVDKTYYK
jgi:hypothetical protein